MKNIYLTLIIALTVNVYAQTSCTVTVTYTAPTCPSCCDGIASAQVMESSSCAPYTYNWSGPGAYISNSQSPNNLCVGNYFINITDNGGTGCCGTMTGTVTIPSGTAGIEQYTTNNNISVYPNPTSTMLNVELRMQNETTSQIQVTDVLGNKVPIPSPSQREGNVIIDVSALPAGVYFIKTTQGISKFVKE